MVTQFCCCLPLLLLCHGGENIIRTLLRMLGYHALQRGYSTEGNVLHIYGRHLALHTVNCQTFQIPCQWVAVLKCKYLILVTSSVIWIASLDSLDYIVGYLITSLAIWITSLATFWIASLAIWIASLAFRTISSFTFKLMLTLSVT
jgi:hypothetical protein